MSFIEKINKGKTDIKSLKLAKPIGRNCPKCGEELLMRSGRYGNFIACFLCPARYENPRVSRHGRNEFEYPF